MNDLQATVSSVLVAGEYSDLGRLLDQAEIRVGMTETGALRALEVRKKNYKLHVSFVSTGTLLV